jgi:hypothetical protein
LTSPLYPPWENEILPFSLSVSLSQPRAKLHHILTSNTSMSTHLYTDILDKSTKESFLKSLAAVREVFPPYIKTSLHFHPAFQLITQNEPVDGIGIVDRIVQKDGWLCTSVMEAYTLLLSEHKPRIRSLHPSRMGEDFCGYNGYSSKWFYPDVRLPILTEIPRLEQS